MKRTNCCVLVEAREGPGGEGAGRPAGEQRAAAAAEHRTPQADSRAQVSIQ